MSVRPVGYDPSGVQVYCDEGQHGGTVPWDDLDFARTPGGELNTDFIRLACPVCGNSSLHPASGGADPDEVPHMFMRAYLAHPDVPDVTWAQAQARAKDANQRLDPDRWFPHHEAEQDDTTVPIRRRAGQGVETVRPGRVRPPAERQPRPSRRPPPETPPSA